MDNFITILHEIKLASTDRGVNVTDQFKNICGRDLLNKIQVVTIGAKDGAHCLRAELKINDNGQCMPRNNSNVESLARVLIIDCDKRIKANGEIKEGAPDPLQVSNILKDNGIGHIIYGTYSHYTGEKGNRYRILLSTNSPYNKEQLPPTAEAIVSLINTVFSHLSEDLLDYATENNAWAQPWYFPRKPVDCDIETLYLAHMDGKPVDIVELLDLPDINHAMPSPTKQLKHGEISVIEAFNNQKKLIDLLSHYGYKRILTTPNYQRWLSPDSTTGRAGITVKGEKLFSHHADELNDGYWHDSWDLWRKMEFLTERDAIIQASHSLLLPDGRTVDEHNKSLASKNKNFEHNSNINYTFADYKPFSDDLLPVESVPYEALPKLMANFIKEQSIIRGCPPDYILVALLARMGCIFSGKIKIALTRNSGWHASPNFFWLMVGDPSSGKSNALSATTKPIQTLEAFARESYKKEFRVYKADMDSLERQLISLKKAVDSETKKINCDYSKISQFEGRIEIVQQQLYDLEDNKPKLKHYTVSKLTIEKLILILEENPEGVLLELDELSSLFVRLSKDENAEERGLYLSGYNGSVPFSYKTISRGDVLIPNVTLSILGGIQPKKLSRFIRETQTGYQDDGFLQRFQGVVFPDRALYLPEDRLCETDLTRDLDHLFQSLDNIQSPKGAESRYLLEFTHPAQSMFDEWREGATKEAHKLSNPIDAHVGKSYEFVASLSAYLYLYENNGQLTVDQKIQADHVRCAIQLGKYFLSQAKRMYGLAYKDDMSARSLSEKLANLILTSTKSEHFDPKTEGYFFTKSQIRTKGWSELKTKEQRREAIGTLINRGYISKPIGERYFINPAYLNE